MSKDRGMTSENETSQLETTEASTEDGKMMTTLKDRTESWLKDHEVGDVRRCEDEQRTHELGGRIEPSMMSEGAGTSSGLAS